MIPDEALTAVKKAVELLPKINRYDYQPTDEDLTTMAFAIRAIAPGGPLVCVRRDISLEMIEAGRAELAASGKVAKIYRAMIAAAGEK